MWMRVLVVEDEPIVALELDYLLSSAGYEVLGPAYTVKQAEALLENADTAVLDINLVGETSEPIATALKTGGKPFLILTALRDGATVGTWANHSRAWLTKPVDSRRLLAELRSIAQSAGESGPAK